MRFLRILVALGLVGLSYCVPMAVPASAGWSPVARFGDAGNRAAVDVAVDARGDAAVAWIASATGSRASSGITGVRVAFRRGQTGAWSQRTVRAARHLLAGQPTVVMAPTGELTVAWIEQLGGHPRVVRAAYRTPRGAWSTVQAIGYATPFVYAYLRLAVAGRGTVGLVYNAGIRAAPGMAAAWRLPGHGFGRLMRVAGDRQLSTPSLSFDPTGTAYLAGTALCGDEGLSHGVLQTAPASTHRFGTPRTITTAPATELRFVPTGSGVGLAAWIGAGCSTTELLAGPIDAERLTPSTLGPVTTVAPPDFDPALPGPQPGPSDTLAMVPAPGGADLVWTGLGGYFAGLYGSHASSDGAIGGLQPLADHGYAPVAADAGGDQVVETVANLAAPTSGRPPPTQLRVAARTAGSGTLDVSSLTGPQTLHYAFDPATATAGSITGRSLIAATTLAPGPLQVATWSP